MQDKTGVAVQEPPVERPETQSSSDAWPPSGVDYSACSMESLSHCVDQLHGIANAALAELFAILVELDRRNAFTAVGAKGAAGWLQVRLGVPYATAARWAETALALRDLPHLRTTFASGRLCLEKVAAAAELATPETDAKVAQDAVHMSAAAIRSEARRRALITAEDERRARAARGVWWWWEANGTWLQLFGRLPAEQGARVTAALERGATTMPPVDADGTTTLTQRRADALAALASVQIAEDADQDRATLMVHVDLQTLRTGVGSAWSEEGALISAETISKLLCDGRLKALVEDAEGKPLGVGRTMRTAPRWMRHAAKARDKTCSFPGCDNRMFLVPHHMHEWTADDGPTDLENLPLLCPIHHRLVHSNDWHIEGSPSEGLVFIGPKGVVRDGPPPLDYDVKKWLWEDLYRPSVAGFFDTS